MIRLILKGIYSTFTFGFSQMHFFKYYKLENRLQKDWVNLGLDFKTILNNNYKLNTITKNDSK